MFFLRQQVSKAGLEQISRACGGGGRVGAVLAISLFHAFLAEAQPAPFDAQGCSARSSPAEQQRCLKIFSERATSSSRANLLDGGWQLVRTTNPRGGPDTVSIMHTSDTAKSDLNLAGLTFRCGRLGIETLLVVLEPLSPELRPLVSMNNGSYQKRFESSVVQGGEAVLLPLEAAKMVISPERQSASEMSVEIDVKPHPIRGTVPVAGLGNALQALSQNCTFR